MSTFVQTGLITMVKTGLTFVGVMIALHRRAHARRLS